MTFLGLVNFFYGESLSDIKIIQVYPPTPASTEKEIEALDDKQF